MAQILPVFGEAAAAVKPSDGALDDPSTRQDDKALELVRALDDFSLKIGQSGFLRGAEDRSGVAAVGEQLLQERKHPEQGFKQQDAAIPVLHAGRCHQSVQEQPLGVHQNMALAALDQLARVKARRINLRPPFSALFTLWLSTMQAVGLISRPTFSRHFS